MGKRWFVRGKVPNLPCKYIGLSAFLFHEVVFGPVRSRRLGLSLGINLSPINAKHCSFNCIYCECGWTHRSANDAVAYPSREEVGWLLEKQLKQLQADDYLPDAITFAGNGEPTLHPDFPAIAGDVRRIRDRLAPDAKVAVLSNASMLHDPGVFDALKSLDNNIQKLDAGTEHLFRLINQPVVPLKLDEVVEGLIRFEGQVIIQSMFLRGRIRGESFDNTTPSETAAWLEKLRLIRPKSVMIYPIARATPVHGLEKIPQEELMLIAGQVRDAGIDAEVYQ